MLILGQALEKGIEVTALARDPLKLGEFRNSVSTVQGSAADIEAVERVVAGNDIVLSALGLVHGSPPGLMTTSSSHMVAAMKRQGSKRLVILTNTAIEDPSDRTPLTHRVLRLVLKRFNEPLWRDSRNAAKVVEESGLDWTLVRAPILTDRPKTGKYKVGALKGRISLRVSRADVASFMLSCALDGSHVREKPVIAG